MPVSDKKIVVPDWLDRLEGNECLSDVIWEALRARHKALRAGAERNKACKNALASAETTLDLIAYGNIAEGRACTKAAVAVRKYNDAYQCAKTAGGLGSCSFVYLKKRRKRSKPRLCK